MGATLRIRAFLGMFSGIIHSGLHRETSDCEVWHLFFTTDRNTSEFGPTDRVLKVVSSP